MYKLFEIINNPNESRLEAEFRRNRKKINEGRITCNNFWNYLYDGFNAKRNYFNQRDNKDYTSELDEKYQNYDELMDDLKQPGQPKDLILFYQKIRELTTKLYQLANQEAESKGGRVETIPPHLMSDNHIISLLDLIDDLKQQRKQTEAGLNQAKSQVLADLKELKGEITDKKITKKVNETYPHTITGTDWTAHLKENDNKITNSWQLAEYVGKVAKIIQAEVIAKEQKATRTAKKELADLENKINDLLGSPHATLLPNDWERCLVKKSIIAGALGLTDYAELTIKLGGANLGTQTDANTNGIPDGKTLKQLIDDYNSGQIKITAYEKIIKDDLGFDPASPDLDTQIKKQLGGVKLAGISTDLKKLVDRYNISNDLQGKLSQVEKEALAAQKELEKYQDFVRSLIENIIGINDNHFEKNDLSALEKDISNWLKDYKEKIENELLFEINVLGLGLNDITKEKVLKVIKELINKPNPDTEIVENLREKIHVQELIITDYQSGDKYMSKEMISNKMQETLKILKIPTSQHYQLASAQSLPEMGTSFEKLLREEVNQKEKARNKLIKINVILAVLTIGSLLTLTWTLIMIKQKNNLLKIEKMKKKGQAGID